MDPDTVRAVDEGIFASLPPELRAAVVEGSFVATFKPRETILSSPARRGAALVLTGLVRVSTSSVAGRSVTLRYARPGDVAGLIDLIAMHEIAHVEAVTDSTVAMLNVRTLKHLSETSLPFSRLLAAMAAETTKQAIELMTLNVFGTVRARLSRHLLGLGVWRGDEIVVDVQQNQLADAIGSVREVVARALKEIEADGLIERRSSVIVLKDIRGLEAVDAF